MLKIGIYPGTFDPITFGHLDVIKRAVNLVDKLVIAVAQDMPKVTVFSLIEREKMVQNEISVLNLNAEVCIFDGLLSSFAKRINASTIIRGLRAVSDFEYEFQMSWVNYKLAPDISTIFLPASEDTQFISSGFVKEIARLGGDVSIFVSDYVKNQLLKRFAH